MFQIGGEQKNTSKKYHRLHNLSKKLTEVFFTEWAEASFIDGRQNIWNIWSVFHSPKFGHWNFSVWKTLWTSWWHVLPIDSSAKLKNIYNNIWTGLSIDRVHNKVPVDTTTNARSACQALLALSAIWYNSPWTRGTVHGDDVWMLNLYKSFTKISFQIIIRTVRNCEK